MWQNWAWPLAIVAIFYPLPLVIAAVRRHSQIKGIAWATILIGWTPTGWVAALWWALMED